MVAIGVLPSNILLILLSLAAPQGPMSATSMVDSWATQIDYVASSLPAEFAKTDCPFCQGKHCPICIKVNNIPAEMSQLNVRQQLAEVSLQRRASPALDISPLEREPTISNDHRTPLAQSDHISPMPAIGILDFRSLIGGRDSEFGKMIAQFRAKSEHEDSQDVGASPPFTRDNLYTMPSPPMIPPRFETGYDPDYVYLENEPEPTASTATATDPYNDHYGMSTDHEDDSTRISRGAEDTVELSELEFYGKDLTDDYENAPRYDDGQSEETEIVDLSADNDQELDQLRSEDNPIDPRHADIMPQVANNLDSDANHSNEIDSDDIDSDDINSDDVDSQNSDFDPTRVGSADKNWFFNSERKVKQDTFDPVAVSLGDLRHLGGWMLSGWKKGAPENKWLGCDEYPGYAEARPADRVGDEVKRSARAERSVLVVRKINRDASESDSNVIPASQSASVNLAKSGAQIYQRIAPPVLYMTADLLNRMGRFSFGASDEVQRLADRSGSQTREE